MSLLFQSLSDVLLYVILVIFSFYYKHIFPRLLSTSEYAPHTPGKISFVTSCLYNYKHVIVFSTFPTFCLTKPNSVVYPICNGNNIHTLLSTRCNIFSLKSNYKHLTAIVSEDIVLASVNFSSITVVEKAITFQIQNVSYSQVVYLVQDINIPVN